MDICIWMLNISTRLFLTAVLGVEMVLFSILFFYLFFWTVNWMIVPLFLFEAIHSNYEMVSCLFFFP